MTLPDLRFEPDPQEIAVWLGVTALGPTSIVGCACFRKNATDAAAHWSRNERSHATSHVRAPGPLSQPAIAQSSGGDGLAASEPSGWITPRVAMPASHGVRYSGPSSGSHDRKRTTAGVSSRSGTRSSAAS